MNNCFKDVFPFVSFDSDETIDVFYSLINDVESFNPESVETVLQSNTNFSNEEIDVFCSIISDVEHFNGFNQLSF